MQATSVGSTVRGRFAPTPSGRMHLGNVFSALMAWLSVRSVGGTLVLRIEDLDPRAQRREVAELLMRDLEWLGLTWDEGPYFQSERTALDSRTRAFALVRSSMRQALRTRPTAPISTRELVAI